MTTLLQEEIGLGRPVKKFSNMKYGVLSSSVNPEKLSLTISGLIKLIPTLLVLAGLFGVSLDGKELEAVANSFLGVILALFSAYSAGEVLWGSIRKVLVRIGFYG